MTKDARKVRIASAFLSSEGVSVLEEMKEEYGLKKTDITLYLSAEFSTHKPHELLRRLGDICVAKIIFQRGFHPKVYLINGSENKLIYGSSNFTLGGLQSNTEFDYIGVPDKAELAELEAFFEYCDSLSEPVTDDVIRFYEENAAEMAKLNDARNALGDKLHMYHRRGDPFLETDYDLSGYYFTYRDYETFFPRNHSLNGWDIRARRKQVQEKILKIHHEIYPQIKKMGVACHKREDNITSTIIPSEYNHYVVAWNGVRYGKTPEEIDAFNPGGGSRSHNEKNKMYGFQKHGCLQYAIGAYGFSINLFLAVKHDAWDRAHMHGAIETLRPDIERELGLLAGYGMRWVIHDSDLDREFVFDIDSEAPEDFCDYFMENDRDGRESFLVAHYPPDEGLLQDFDSICEEVLDKTELLLPLYNVMVHRPKGRVV